MLGLIHDRAPAFLFILVVLLNSLMLAVTVVPRGDSPITPAPIPSNPPRIGEIPQPIQEPVDDPVAHVNSVGDYRFIYPAAWVVVEDGSLTRVGSPTGDIVMSFRIGAQGDIATASDRLLSSILDAEGNDPRSDQGLIGTTWERIDGSRSLIVSGTTTDAIGRSMRFLAITVQGVPRNYSISVLVPARSDPARVLPTIEAIVSSFQILEPMPTVVI